MQMASEAQQCGECHQECQHPKRKPAEVTLKMVDRIATHETETGKEVRGWDIGCQEFSNTHKLACALSKKGERDEDKELKEA
jgi:hypothetical protein